VIELINNLKVPTQPIFAGLSAQDLIFLAFFLGFAIKVPMFPFHTWLPDAHTDAPRLAASSWRRIAEDGHLWFRAFEPAPVAGGESEHDRFVGLLAIIGVLYGALVAMAQHDMKRLIAYSSVSHMVF
jgi:NADH-quinone oxidoreductase subunit M